MSARALAALLLLAGCASPPVAQAPATATSAWTVPLRNPGFEEPPRAGERCAAHWSCTMHNDVDSFRFTLESQGAASGRQALCVQRVRDEPWALATQALHDPALRGKRLRLSLALRTDGAVQGRGAGPWALVHGERRPLGHFERLVPATRGWERVSVEFTVAPESILVEMGVTLEGGGRVCIDDVRVELLR